MASVWRNPVVLEKTSAWNSALPPVPQPALREQGEQRRRAQDGGQDNPRDVHGRLLVSDLSDSARKEWSYKPVVIGSQPPLCMER